MSNSPVIRSFNELLFGLLEVPSVIWEQHLSVPASRKKISEFLGVGINAILLHPSLYTPVRAMCLAQAALNIKATKDKKIQTPATIAIGSALTVLERCPTAVAHSGCKIISLTSDALIEKYDGLKELPLGLTSKLDQASLALNAQIDLQKRRHLPSLKALEAIVTIVKNTSAEGPLVE